MKIEVSDSRSFLYAVREPFDLRMKNDGQLLYHVCRALRDAGLDVIKKNPQSDGHLTSANTYVRERGRSGRESRFAVWNGNYQIRDKARDFNREGRAGFHIEGDADVIRAALKKGSNR